MQIGILSEDDIRTKVVYVWLKDCGISDSDLFIEYTIKLRLGRGEKTINSRSDVVVKDRDGNNLFVIEVKKPNHRLEHNDKWQAISYARCLASGGIAPFAVLTNGLDSQIFDTLTGQLISNNNISPDNL